MDSSGGIELEGLLGVVGLNAPDVVRRGGGQRRHQRGQRRAELGAHCLLLARGAPGRLLVDKLIIVIFHIFNMVFLQ